MDAHDSLRPASLYHTHRHTVVLCEQNPGSVHHRLASRLRELECVCGSLWLLVCDARNAFSFREARGIDVVLRLLQHHNSAHLGKAAIEAKKAADASARRKARRRARDVQLGVVAEETAEERQAREEREAEAEKAKALARRARRASARLLLPSQRLLLSAMLEVLRGFKAHFRPLLNKVRVEAATHGLLLVCEALAVDESVPVTVRVVATHVYRLMSFEREGGVVPPDTDTGGGSAASVSSGGSRPPSAALRRLSRQLGPAVVKRVGGGVGQKRPSSSGHRHHPDGAAASATEPARVLQKQWKKVTPLALLGVRFLSPAEHFVIRNLGTTLLEESVATGATRKRLAQNGGLAALTQYLEYAYTAYTGFRTPAEHKLHAANTTGGGPGDATSMEDVVSASAPSPSNSRRAAIRRRRSSVASRASSVAAGENISLHDFLVKAVTGESKAGVQMLLQDPDKDDPYVCFSTA